MKSTITHYQDLEADIGTAAKDVLVKYHVDHLVRGSDLAQVFVTLGPKLYLETALAMCEQLKGNLGLGAQAVEDTLIGLRTLAQRFDGPVPPPEMVTPENYSEAEG